MSDRSSLRIDSPAKSPYLSQVISDYELGPQGGVVAPFRLGRRHALSGTVIAADGKPVPDVTIQAEGIADEGGRVPGSTSSTSTTDGAFVLYVDPGTYNIEVQPHPTSGVPRFTILGREVQSSEEGLEFQAPPATVIDGEIRVPDGHGADGFTVRAYSSLSSNGDNATAVALLRGTALSDENGRFRILIGDL